MKRHLVVCGTGHVGSFVVDVLLGKALHVRATTERKSRVRERGPIAWTYLDMATGEGLEQAFAGIHRAVLVLPMSMPKPHAALARCIREARRRHVEKLILITDACDGPFDECERALERSDVPHEIVRTADEDDPRRVAAAAVQLLTQDRIAPRRRGYPDNPGVLNAA